MAQATDETKTAEEAKREEAYRAVQANIIGALSTALEPGETLLGFTRGRISGGFKGKLSVGIEALFAPDVNIGLTDRRLILQHITNTTGKPSQILPHTFPLEKLAQIGFSDIETYGGELAGRLSVRETDETVMRFRLVGKEFCADAITLSTVFRSLIQAQQQTEIHPTSPPCPSCGRPLNEPARFCPYCGTKISTDTADAPTVSKETIEEKPEEKPLEVASPTASHTETPIVAELAEAQPSEPSTENAQTPVMPDFSPSLEVQAEASSPVLPEVPPYFPPSTLVESENQPETRAEEVPSRAPIHILREEPRAELDAGAEIPAGFAEGSVPPLPPTPPIVEPMEARPEPKTQDEFWRDFARISGINLNEASSEAHPETPKEVPTETQNQSQTQSQTPDETEQH